MSKSDIATEAGANRLYLSVYLFNVQSSCKSLRLLNHLKLEKYQVMFLI